MLFASGVQQRGCYIYILKSFFPLKVIIYRLGLEMVEEPEIKLPTSTGSLKKQESPRKISTALLVIPKPLTVWITTN